MRNRQNRRRGFTAVEIAMVATVIAILALLILPIFRQRAAEARVVAAQDELQSMVKALLLIEADLGDVLPRLNDLDNPDNEPPHYKWDTTSGYWVEILAPERATMEENWQGPYAAVKTYAERQDLDGTLSGTADYAVSDGPVYFNATYDLPEERYPIDPWGSPYLLFGPETVYGSTGASYNVRAIYSLGPDRLPGSGVAFSPTNYFDRDLLGTGDDLEFLF